MEHEGRDCNASKGVITSTITSKARNIELEASSKNRGPLWIRVSENVKQKEELTDTWGEQWSGLWVGFSTNRWTSPLKVERKFDIHMKRGSGVVDILNQSLLIKLWNAFVKWGIVSLFKVSSEIHRHCHWPGGTRKICKRQWVKWTVWGKEQRLAFMRMVQVWRGKSWQFFEGRRISR